MQRSEERSSSGLVGALQRPSGDIHILIEDLTPHGLRAKQTTQGSIPVMNETGTCLIVLPTSTVEAQFCVEWVNSVEREFGLSLSGCTPQSQILLDEYCNSPF